MGSMFQTMRKTGLRFRLYIFVALFCIAAAAAAAVYSYRLVGDLTEAASAGDVDSLLRLLLIVSAIAAIRIVFEGGRALYAGMFGAGAGYNLRRMFIRHFLHAPYASVTDAKGGESLSIFQNDIPPSAELVANQFLNILENFVFFVAGFAFLMFISPMYTGISIGAAVALLVFVMLLSMPVQGLMKKSSEKEAAYNGIINDSLQNLSTVAAYSLHGNMEGRFLAAFADYMKAFKRMIAALLVQVIVSFLAMMGPLIVIFTILGLAVIGGDMLLGDFVAFSLAITVSAGSIMGLGQSVGQFRQSAGRARRLVDATAHPHESETGAAAADPAEGIVFENVTFSYKEDLPPALDGASFAIKPGTRTAFVGPSGSGKSTVLKLLLGLYEATGGEVRVGGADIKDFAKKGLRDCFAYVPQDSFLFPYSIRQNVSALEEPADEARLEKACRDAGILDFINSLPDKFDGALAEASENISGGQKQRIALARAFYKDAGIILFDEATSSLDPATEAEVLQNLMAAAKGKTVIMVAHRAAAIAACDSVIVMDGGKVSATGAHEELMKTSPVYQGLYSGSEVAV